MTTPDPLLLAVAGVFSLIYVPTYLHIPGWQAGFIADFVAPLAAMGWVVLILSMLRRHAGAPNAKVRALVDASFTIYLLHQPVILILGLLLLPVHAPPVLEWLLITPLTLGLCYAVHGLIRSHPILLFAFNGVLPHFREQPRRV